MSPQNDDRSGAARYRDLGLLGNPFLLQSESKDFDGRDYEMLAEANVLLGEILSGAEQEKSKPIVVNKTNAVPSFYPLRSIGFAEHAMATDDSLGVLHGYVPMFLMRLGRVRAMLQVISERLVFRQFDKTLALYIAKVLAEPDESLIAYQVLGGEALDAFAETFQADPDAATESLFGDPKILERRPELTEVGDVRTSGLEADVEDEETTPEIDASVGDAPGTDRMLGEEADARDQEDVSQALVDYIVEYTKIHLSPVVSRALRVYRERGLAALAHEFTITKAPKKTLAAVVKFARVRFDKVVLVFDGYDGWIGVPADMRLQISSSLSEVRWALESDAIIVMMLEKGAVAELEELFAAGTQLDWSFPGVIPLQDAPDAIDTEIVNRWLAAAAFPHAEPLTMDDSTLSSLAAASDGSLKRFVGMALAAVESAGERGVSSLDADALADGLAAGRGEEAQA